MNKYKMITICSLTIVCILILSLFFPSKIKADDKENLEVKLSYENSSVTININVNTKEYSGVICKYIEIDDVYAYDDLLDQTKDFGNSLNLNKSEEDKYNTIIENITKRFVVVYVSIGDFHVCDYIDCSKQVLNSTEENQIQNETEDSNQEHEQNQNESETENSSQEQEQNQNESANNNQEQEQNKDEITNINQEQEQNKDEITNINQEQEKEPAKEQENKEQINIDDFQEIPSNDKHITVSIPEGKIPQTGENNTIKIIGIIVFSIIAAISFYKYKISLKESNITEAK